MLTIENRRHPQILEIGVQHCVDGRQTFFSGEILSGVRTSQVEPNTISVPRLKTFVVHPKLDMRGQRLRQIVKQYVL